mmetsp:Transcript_38889/g.66376  ORF Transcript_38889/g.66376 Transcript_38889/m.66376 type:complete len:253 (+) Transcript_38889:37-795(+)
MISRQALIVVVAAAATIQNTSAFAPSVNRSPLGTTSLYSSASGKAAKSQEEDVEMTRQVIMAHIESADVSTETEEDEKKPIMDIPPMPIAVEEPSSKAKPAAAKKVAPKKKKGGVHKEGVFSPIVIAAGAVLGDDQLNKIRAKIISLHSDIIKSFVGTSDSEFGKAVLRQIFDAVDTDNSGYLDKEELAVALNMLGFKWLGEKQVEKIFARADANGDLEISLEEFMEEAPKTLKVNLVKLAKNNGGDMGLLV